MTDPTPTRDEAVPTGWKLAPEEPAFSVLIAGRDALMDTDDEIDLSTDQIRECWRAMLASFTPPVASTPAPASGGVHAVREALLGYVLKPGQYETASVFARGQNRVAVDMLGVLDEASLSPAATPGLSLPSREWMRDKIAADPDVEDCGVVPAATPVSEAGGEHETVWCESCGEAPVSVRLDVAGLCAACAKEQGE